jgi:IS5 family transposase
LFKALRLATGHDLSDEKLAEALDNRASFRRFCGLAAHQPTALSRFAARSGPANSPGGRPR